MSAARAPDAPESERPLTWRDVPSVLAVLALIPGFFIVAIDIANKGMGNPPMQERSQYWYWVCFGSVAWLLGSRLLGWIDKRSGDRCLDVLGWLFPKMPVYETRGVHYQALGWLTHSPSPELRVVVLAQSCYLGCRILRLNFPSKHSAHFDEEPIHVEANLEGGSAYMALVRRSLNEWPDKVLLDLRATVEVKSSGTRIRWRRGRAPETIPKEMAGLLLAVHNPLHLASWALNRAPQKAAPFEFHRISELEQMDWPSESFQPIWIPDSGWQLKGATHELMSRISETYGRVSDSKGALGLPEH